MSNYDTLGMIKQRLEILYQLVDELEAGGGGGGGGGTTNYNELSNKPSIEGQQLVGNKTASDLGLATTSQLNRKVDKEEGSSLMTAAQATKLEGIQAGAEVNVQADWNQTNSNADDYIKNKPTIPTPITVDQTYNATSANAQSGKAVAQAISTKVDKETGKGLSTNDFTTAEKNNLASLTMRKVYSTIHNTSTTHTYTIKVSDFNNSQAGTYLITIVTWSVTPSFSLYAVSYSGNVTTTTNLTKIAGADANISVTDGVISCTTTGKIQIIAVQ